MFGAHMGYRSIELTEQGCCSPMILDDRVSVEGLEVCPTVYIIPMKDNYNYIYIYIYIYT